MITRFWLCVISRYWPFVPIPVQNSSIQEKNNLGSPILEVVGKEINEIKESIVNNENKSSRVIGVEYAKSLKKSWTT